MAIRVGKPSRHGNRTASVQEDRDLQAENAIRDIFSDRLDDFKLTSLFYCTFIASTLFCLIHAGSLDFVATSCFQIKIFQVDSTGTPFGKFLPHTADKVTLEQCSCQLPPLQAAASAFHVAAACFLQLDKTIIAEYIDSCA